MTETAKSTQPPTAELTYNKPTRTQMDCHNCSKQFVALLDYQIDGNHIVECPHCGHEHCRVIKAGKITGDRWDSREGGDKERDGIKVRRVWKHDVLPARTTAISEFIRERWLERFHT